MNKCKTDVKSEKNVVGVAEYNEYDTLAEAQTELGEAKCVELINALVRTNAMNIVRTAATKGPTKSSLRNEAMSEIVTEIAGGEHKEIIGDKLALEALVTKRMGVLEAQMKANISTVEDEDDEDDE